MRPLVIAFVVFAGTVYSNMALIEKLHNTGLAKNPLHIRALHKRDIDKSDNSAENFYNFIEEKLMHQNQALEHLITSVDNTGDMIKKLIDNLSKGLEKPKMPTKAEPEKPGSRRLLDDSTVGSDQQNEEHKVNPWCPIALLCQKKDDPVCGFDEEFGYGRFEDFCHLLRVNCYWKYNFSVVSSCQPKL
ncbi:uncharacterized protein LOC111348941 isoform X2 [Spodoptera litura]|uniref:Uncharacterized protein LOC111348941 isoform X2 n=1 Tax=Spodoptera litura TaxID=69820 RepID=A0A9J7IIS3_SPOLT|nr:uncharacterized protein LOC111348941 isoform X2 [Spodoptera litura]